MTPRRRRDRAVATSTADMESDVLIISRRPGQAVVVHTQDGPVTVIVLGLRKGGGGSGIAKVGIEAPGHLKIDRAERAEVAAAPVKSGAA